LPLSEGEGRDGDEEEFISIDLSKERVAVRGRESLMGGDRSDVVRKEVVPELGSEIER